MPPIKILTGCFHCLTLFGLNAVQFPEDYPSSAPQIVFLTTNGGKTRFNPNLYADGKVCLSILGTWRGESGEQWSSVQNCQSVMVSIQSLMDDKPYHNEPGFEKVCALLQRVMEFRFTTRPVVAGSSGALAENLEP